MKGEEDAKYMDKQVITYSDGTETVINYKQNESQVEIEATVAEAVAGDHKTNNETVVETTDIEEPESDEEMLNEEVA